MISIADVCNNTFKENEAPITLLAKTLIEKNLEQRLKKNYKTLFAKAKGAIILSASKPGKYSYSYMTKGSFLTFGFLDALKSETSSNGKPTWSSILEKTYDNTTARARELNVEQEPQYLNSIQ